MVLPERTQDRGFMTRRGRELVQSYKEEEGEAGCPVRLALSPGSSPGGQEQRAGSL